MILARWFVFLLGSLFLVGCGVEVVIHDIGEKEANEILVLLDQHEIAANKTIKDTGRAIFYSITVKPSEKVDALKVLNEHDYPRRPPHGYDTVYAAGGLIPTSSEEGAKKLQAIEGEIERQLGLVSGVLDAEVNLVVPEENPLRTNEGVAALPSASVTLKYMPDQNNQAPFDKEELKLIVAASVEKLSRDNVVLALTPARPPAGGGNCPDAPAGKGILGRLPDRTQKLLIAGAALLVLLLSLGLAFGQIRLRNVRERLIRLQNEIAKARRKGPEPAAAE